MFTDSKIDEAVLENAGICQNCFIKFNEYDEHQTMANQIQIELMGMYRKEIASFVDVKQEIKVEDEDFYYAGFGETIVEVTDDIYPEEFRRVAPKKKTTSMRPKAVKAETSSTVKYPKAKSSYVKKEKDAGLLVSIVDGVKLYSCEYCGKKGFTSRSRLKTHKLIHTDERNYMCQSCGASFKTMNCLKNHSRLHNNVFYYCDLCSSRFKGKHELRCHMVCELV
jgi:5-methylcytosine-specific restriction endonuclease McrA